MIKQKYIGYKYKGWCRYFKNMILWWNWNFSETGGLLTRTYGQSLQKAHGQLILYIVIAVKLL